MSNLFQGLIAGAQSCEGSSNLLGDANDGLRRLFRFDLKGSVSLCCDQWLKIRKPSQRGAEVSGRARCAHYVCVRALRRLHRIHCPPVAPLDCRGAGESPSLGDVE